MNGARAGYVADDHFCNSLPGTTRELEGFPWWCMADPDGNEFDIDVLPPG